LVLRPPSLLSTDLERGDLGNLGILADLTKGAGRHTQGCQDGQVFLDRTQVPAHARISRVVAGVYVYETPKFCNTQEVS